MTEPLVRRLAARGEQITVGALPWVAPVYRAMPQVDEVIEFPFQHGGLQFKARRAIARQVEGRFDSAYVLPNSLKSALLPFLASIPRRVGHNRFVLQSNPRERFERAEVRHAAEIDVPVDRP